MEALVTCDLYYKALRRTPGTLAGDAPDWEPWVGFFLRCLKRPKDGLATLARPVLPGTHCHDGRFVLH